jgi:hypothetical protein
MSPQDLTALRTAVESRDLDGLHQSLRKLERSRESVPLLAQILLEDWHDLHEDIVFELGLIGDPRAIQSIAKAIHVPFASLVKWGNVPEFQRKCAYALARIGTNESRAALETIASNADPQLREYGEEGLSKWPLPYRGN